ncbi:MAG: class II aldolase/adducin family protein [Pseudomonadota bacterium]
MISTILEAARQELAAANRILFNQGVVDAFGHVSMRHPTEPGQFLLSRNMAPATVTAADVLAFDMQGQLQGGGNHKVYLERFIHAAIYAQHPEVNGVVHSHAKAVLPFTIVKSARLRPVCHMGGFLSGVVPNFEIRDHAGTGSNMLITNMVLGNALATTLGKNAVVLMRGHGSTATGASVQQAVFRAVYTQNNAEIQAAGMALGEVTHLTDEEALAADEANTGQISRAWDFWLSQAQA